MAAITNSLKRPLPEDDKSNPQKRSRSDNVSPAPATNSRSAIGKPDISKAVQDARARATEVAARLAKARTGQTTISNAAPAAAVASAPSSIQDRVAEMKARVAAARERATAVASTTRMTATPTPAHQPAQYEDNVSRARGGLDVGLHPSLIGDSGIDSRSTSNRQAMQPKFATTMANRKSNSGYDQKKGKKENQLDLSGPSLEEIKANPYFDPSLDPKVTMARSRHSRHLIFNEPGKYIQQASAMRNQAKLEAMKKKIADSAKKAGMIDDIDTERAFVVPEPPEIEWWDEAYVNGKDYSNIDGPNGTKIDGEDTIVTIYIQHPVAIEPPQEKIAPAPKPMFLTPKEQAKLRRQTRKENLKEQQMKVRLGLEPPPPPKVKISNLMRVLGEEAVKDPTAVEARVNREIAERLAKHEKTNADRALSKDAKVEKLAAQQAGDAAKGIHSLIFKIDSLVNGQHRYKVWKNAEQQALTGLCILHPKFCLVVAEGGEHSIKAYKKLMLNRIDWHVNVSPKKNEDGQSPEPLTSWLRAEDDKGNLKDIGFNKCTLVWEGEQKRRAFRKWGTKVCETDKDAKDALSRSKMENFWTLAKSQASE